MSMHVDIHDHDAGKAVRPAHSHAASHALDTAGDESGRLVVVGGGHSAAVPRWIADSGLSSGAFGLSAADALFLSGASIGYLSTHSAGSRALLERIFGYCPAPNGGRRIAAAALAAALGLAGAGLAADFLVPSGGVSVVSNISLGAPGSQTMHVSDGGTAVSTIINMTGAQDVYSGGIASGTTATIFGSQNVHDSGVAYDTVLNVMGIQNIKNGGLAIGTVVNNGGTQNISGGGIVSGTIVNGGQQHISNGGIADDTHLKSGTITVSGGGTANRTVISSGTQNVNSDGIANSTHVLSGGRQYLSGGTSYDTVLSSGGLQTVFDSGTAFRTSVGEEARQNISAGGTAVSAVVTSNGVQHILDSGIASGTTLGEQGLQYVSSGGKADGTVVDDGVQWVFDGGSATNAVIGSAGRQYLHSSGAWASGTTVNQGGIQDISAGALAIDTTVRGGIQVVLDGGAASATTVDSGILALSGGSLLGINTVSNGTVGGSSGMLAAGNSLVFTPTSGHSALVENGLVIDGGGAMYKRDTGTLRFNGTAGTTVLTVSEGALNGAGTLGGLTFSGGAFAPLLDAASGTGETLTVSGNVTGMANATLAPVWKNNTPLAVGQTASFLVLDAAGFDANGFGASASLAGYDYNQRVEGGGLGKLLYLDMLAKALELQKKYGNAMTPNAFNAAGVLDNADAADLLPEVIDALRGLPANAAVVADAVNRLHHEGAATSQITGAKAVRLFSQNIPGIYALDAGQSLVLGAGPIRSDNALAAISYAKPNAITLFASPFGSWATQHSHDRYSGYSFDLGGIAVGGLRTFNNFQYGIVAGYDRQSQKMRDFPSRIDGDLFHLALFGGYKTNNLFIDASIGYSHAWNDSERHVAFGTLNHRNTGSFGQDFWSGRLAFGYIFEMPKCFRLIPGISFDYVHARAKAFRESGSSSALSMAANSYDSLELPASLALEKDFRSRSGAVITPRIGAAWIPELADKRARTTASFVQAPVAGWFEAQSIASGRNRGQFTAGIRARFSDRTTLTLDYTFDFARSYTNHNLAASFGITF